MRFTAIFTPNTLYSNNVLKSNEKTKMRQLFVTAKFFCCESEKNFPPHPRHTPALPLPAPRTSDGPTPVVVQNYTTTIRSFVVESLKNALITLIFHSPIQ